MSINVYFTHRSHAVLAFLHFKRPASVKRRGQPRSVHFDVEEARSLHAEAERAARRGQPKGIVLGISEFIPAQAAFKRNLFVFRRLRRFIATSKKPEFAPSVWIVVVHQQQRSRRHSARTTRAARVVDTGEAPALVGTRLLRKRGERNLECQSPALLGRLGRVRHSPGAPFPLNRAGDWQKFPAARYRTPGRVEANLAIPILLVAWRKEQLNRVSVPEVLARLRLEISFENPLQGTLRPRKAKLRLNRGLLARSVRIDKRHAGRLQPIIPLRKRRNGNGAIRSVLKPLNLEFAPKGNRNQLEAALPYGIALYKRLDGVKLRLDIGKHGHRIKRLLVCGRNRIFLERLLENLIKLLKMRASLLAVHQAPQFIVGGVVVERRIPKHAHAGIRLIVVEQRRHVLGREGIAMHLELRENAQTAEIVAEAAHHLAEIGVCDGVGKARVAAVVAPESLNREPAHPVAPVLEKRLALGALLRVSIEARHVAEGERYVYVVGQRAILGLAGRPCVVVVPNQCHPLLGELLLQSAGDVLVKAPIDVGVEAGVAKPPVLLGYQP